MEASREVRPWVPSVIADVERDGVDRLGGWAEVAALEKNGVLVQVRGAEAWRPRYQVHEAAVASEVVLADARAAALRLRSVDPSAYAALTETQVHVKGLPRSAWDRAQPVLSFGVRGFQLRWSAEAVLPASVSAEARAAWARAVDAYFGLLRSPEFRVRVSLRQGEVLIWDNLRMWGEAPQGVLFDG